MGRKRARTEPVSLPASLPVYGHILAEKASAQDAGTDFYGQAVYPHSQRQPSVPTFYPLPLERPPPAVQHPIYQQEDYTVEQPDHALINVPMQLLLQNLLESAAPTAPPQPMRAKAQPAAQPRPPEKQLTAAEEKALVEGLRMKGHTWVHIANVIGNGKSASSIRKKYPNLPTPSSPFNATLPATTNTPLSNLGRPPINPAQAASPLQPPGSSQPPSSGATIARRGSEQGSLQDGGELSSGAPTPTEQSPTDNTLHAPRAGHSNDPLVCGVRVGDMINDCIVERGGGSTRVQLKRPLKRAPDDFTGAAAHGLRSLTGVKFFEEATVQDPDDPTRFYSFTLQDRTHCASFHMGVGADGAPILSWSDLFAFYQLPDGSKWAEHGYFHDAEDVATLGTLVGKESAGVVPEDMGDKELLRRGGRYHSRLQNIEFECWVFQEALPKELPETVLPDEAFFWRHSFDPYSMERTS